MQFEDIIFGVIAELRNMDHPFIDEWEIEDNCCRKSQVLDELPRASLLAQNASRPKLRHTKPPSPNQRHSLIIQLTSPTNHQKLKKTLPAANEAPLLPASAKETTDAGNHGAQARESEPVDAAPEDDATIGVPTFDELIAAARELLDAELGFDAEQPAGPEDVKTIKEENQWFTATYVPLGGTPAPTPVATTRTHSSFASPSTRTQPPRPTTAAKTLAPASTTPAVSPDLARKSSGALHSPRLAPPKRPPPEVDRVRWSSREYVGVQRVLRRDTRRRLKGCLDHPAQRVPGSTIEIATERVC